MTSPSNLNNAKNTPRSQHVYRPEGDLDLNALIERIRLISAPRVLRIKGVTELTSKSRSHIYSMLNPLSPAFDPDFPKPFRLGKADNSPSVWWEEEIVSWMRSKAQTRTTGGEATH